ncbi:uncharacterized protein [Panulirus ornatus]|uniref:uncharacterized protein n=1 Tax=Panulirus ornatus TaxID=150431 RepID=UPI003A84284F
MVNVNHNSGSHEGRRREGMRHGSLWFPLLLTETVLLLVAGEMIPSRTYKFLPMTGEITGNYTPMGIRNLPTCGSECSQQQGCWVYTWHAMTGECRLLESFPFPIVTMVAEAFLRTYYVAGWDSRLLHLSSTPGTWTEVKAQCEDMGGRLALPPHTASMMILHHVFQDANLYVGMQAEGGKWVDMRGRVATEHPNWAPNTLNNTGVDNYALGNNGYLIDIGDNTGFRGLCEV